jgi:hypothetical protein
MAAGNWIIYDSAKKLLCNGGIDFDSDTIKMALVTSSYTPALTHTQWSDVSGSELASGSGYTTGGATVSATVTNSGSTTKLSASADPSWTASGGSLTLRYAVLYKSGSGGGLTNPLIGYVALDTASNITLADGTQLIVGTPSGGFWDLTGATS